MPWLRSVKQLDGAVAILEKEYEAVQEVKAEISNLENDRIDDAEKKQLLGYLYGQFSCTRLNEVKGQQRCSSPACSISSLHEAAVLQASQW